jgi:DNA-binding beta-propeller fold protein YncE
MRIVGAVSFVALAIAMVGPMPALAQERVVLTNSETPLAKIPFDSRGSRSIVLSADGLHGAYVAGEGPYEWVVIDGETSAVYERVARDSLVFSPDGTRMAFAARLGGRWYVASGNGNAEEPFDAVVARSVRFSPDGRRLAFIATRERRTFVVADGGEGPAFDAIADDRIAFSPAGRLAYVGVRAGRRVVVIDGAESLPFADATFPVFSGDGLRAAYLASDGRRQFIAFDDFARQDAPEDTRALSLTLSHNGSRVAYAFGPPGAVRVAIADRAEGDGKRETSAEAVDWVFDGSIAFSPDGTRVAYAVRKGGHAHAVVDGKAGPPLHGVVPGTIVFSPDGRRHAYVAEQATGPGTLGRIVVVDGTAWMPFEWVRGVPRFSPDSRHVACVAEYTVAGLTGQFVVVDGSPSGKAYTCVRGDPVFSPDGTRVAVIALAHDDRFAAGEELPRLAAANVPGGAADVSGRRLVLDRTAADRLGVLGFQRRSASPPPLEMLLVHEEIAHD